MPFERLRVRSARESPINAFDAIDIFALFLNLITKQS